MEHDITDFDKILEYERTMPPSVKRHITALVLYFCQCNGTNYDPKTVFNLVFPENKETTEKQN